MKGGENLRFLPRSKLKREKNEKKEGGRKRIEEKKANKEQIGSKKKKTMKMVKNGKRLDKHFHDFERKEKSCLSRLT